MGSMSGGNRHPAGQVAAPLDAWRLRRADGRRCRGTRRLRRTVVAGSGSRLPGLAAGSRHGPERRRHGRDRYRPDQRARFSRTASMTSSRASRASAGAGRTAGRHSTLRCGRAAKACSSCGWSRPCPRFRAGSDLANPRASSSSVRSSATFEPERRSPAAAEPGGVPDLQPTASDQLFPPLAPPPLPCGTALAG